MATLALAGVAKAASWGWFANGLATAAGAYIDSRTIFRPDRPGQLAPNRDAKVQLSEEGAPVPTVFGTARVPCQPIWVSELREQDSGGGNGKGGQGGNALTYTYSCDVAYACAVGPIEEFEEIWANGKRIYAQNPDVLITGFNPSLGTESHTFRHINLSPTDQDEFSYRYEIVSSSSGPDLTELVTGNDVVISGWTGSHTGNNVTATVVSVRRDDATDETFLVIALPSVRVNHTTSAHASPANPFVNYNGLGSQSITIAQSNVQFSVKQMSSIALYPGDESQLPDPTIEALEPNGAPAFRGLAYFVIHDLQLQDYGNMPPAQVEVRVRKKTGQTVGEVIEYLCAASGIEAGEVDASACTAECGGFYYLGASKAASVLETVLLTYDIVHQQRDGVLTFFPREDAIDVTVDADDLATHVYGQDGVRDLRISDPSAFGRLREVTVLYRDPEKKWQTASARVRRASSRSDRSEQYDTAVTMSSEEAHQVAGRLLWLNAINARRVEVDLPPSYCGRVHESDRISFTAHGHPFTVLLDTVDTGDNGLIRASGVIEDPRVLVQPAIGGSELAADDFIGTQNPQTSPPFIEWDLIDCACIRDAHVDTPGFYWAVTLPDERFSYSGAVLYESVDGGTTYTEIGRSILPATSGTATTVAEAGVAACLWDDASVLDVVMDRGELSSVTDLQCQNGANRLAYGGEIVGFVNAELIARNTYRLTRLLRGLQGTEHEIGEHQIGDRVVCLTAAGVEFVSVNVAAIGQPRLYKCVPIGGRLEDYEDREIALQGANVRPLPPVNVVGTRDGSNNLTVSFVRRGRGVARLFATSPVPIHESRVTYLVDILDPTVSFTARSESVASSLDSVSLTYSAADQTTDGYTPGDPVTLRVRQLSSWLGSGLNVEATV